MVQLNLSTGEPIILKAAPEMKFKGQRIPGSSLYMTEREGLFCSVHLYPHPLFKLSLRQFRFSEATRIIIKEHEGWLRLELSISGTAGLQDKQGNIVRLRHGQYQLTDQAHYAADFAAGEHVYQLVIYYSDQLLEDIGPVKRLAVCPPRPAPHDMMDMVHELLKCPFKEEIRCFYYANKAREILFCHLVSLAVALPGELNEKQLAAMYEADRIMADNMDGKLTLPELARRVGTNFVTLKKNYEKVFGIGIFPRMMQRRMAHIQQLLEHTDLPLKEIADRAGYQTLPGFINAFRKRYKVTPKEWRKKRRGI